MLLCRVPATTERGGDTPAAVPGQKSGLRPNWISAKGGMGLWGAHRDLAESEMRRSVVHVEVGGGDGVGLAAGGCDGAVLGSWTP